jgi:hypothetical protein
MKKRGDLMSEEEKKEEIPCDLAGIQERIIERRKDAKYLHQELGIRSLCNDTL